MTPNRTIVIAAGGTGGHVYPGVAVGERLRDLGFDLLLCIGDDERDRRLSTALPAWLRRIEIPSRRPPRSVHPAIATFAWRSWRDAGRLAARLRPERVAAVLAMGGFPSLVPALAARRLPAPLVLHEANAIPGRANRLLARWATEVLVGWEPAAARFPGRPCRTVGVPVRADIAAARTPGGREQARASLGIDPDALVLLVVGGSQGAVALNRAFADAWPRLRAEIDGLVALVVAGPGRAVETATAATAGGGGDSAPETLRVVEFEPRMDRFYAAADLAVTRAGAGALSELAAVGAPALVVPYPHAADRHQDANAECAAVGGGVEIIPETDLDGARLADAVIALAADPARREAMATALRDLRMDEAAARVAGRVAAVAGATAPGEGPASSTAMDDDGIGTAEAAVRAAGGPGSVVRARESMSRHTRLRVGGDADLYVEPADEDALAGILTTAAATGSPVCFVGYGSNLLVRDGGLRGIAIRLRAPAFRRVRRTGPIGIEAGAGAALREVVGRSIEWGIGGFEFLEGIPGSVGGAVRMNAGAMGSELRDVVRRVRVIAAGQPPRWRDAADLGFRYRGCDRLGDDCVVAVEFAGAPAPSDEVERTVRGFEERRHATQPGGRTAGCTFRNLPDEPAGRLIDQLGLKGLRRGGAQVSPDHANFIVTERDARAADVLWLIERVRDTVRRERGIELETEVVVVGEETKGIRQQP